MSDVEKVARAIPDEVFDAAMKAYKNSAGYPLVPANHSHAMRIALEAALAAMGEREAVGMAVADLIDKMLLHLDDVQDEGPEGEGWKSSELSALMGQAKGIAAAIRSTAEPPAPTPLKPSIPDQR